MPFFSHSPRALLTITGRRTRTRTRTSSSSSSSRNTTTTTGLPHPLSSSSFSSLASVYPSRSPSSTSSFSTSTIVRSDVWIRSLYTRVEEGRGEDDTEKISGPLPHDSSSLIDEREFHRLADELLNHIQEEVDEMGEELNVDGFDIDHAEGVITIKLGASGTYVINKQTPNRQIWLSSPVSGPARFDWDTKHKHWVYRRTKARLLELLEKEMNQLLGASITFSAFKQQ